MARREYPVRIACADGTCRESVTYRCETRAEENDALVRQREKPWKCIRHARPEQHLRPGNETASVALTASRIKARPWRGEPERYLDGLYWLPDGEGDGSGYVHGPGFNAFAADFPEGTRLLVTAQIVAPEVRRG